MTEQITCNDEIMAIIIRSTHHKPGIEFLTPNNFSQQLGYMSRASGYKIEPHFHNLVHREVFYTSEVLFIRSGAIRIDFYNNKKELFMNSILVAGDVILLAQGGHGIEVLEDAEIVEVKQGPYMGDLDKTRFNPSC